MPGIAGRRLLGAALGLLLIVGAAHAGKRRELEELINFALDAEYSHWLVGPVARIASDAEIDAYLRLSDDEAAVAFIDEFWNDRLDASNPWPDQQPRAVFERRSEEADRKFTEGVRLGRRTDRGEIFVVFGEPLEIEYEEEPDSRGGPIEIWRYGKKAPRGLGGEKPKKLYRFNKQDGVTVFYSPSPTVPRRNRRGVIR